MRWVDALKIYNAGKSWCIPRKGTPEHAAVRAIMERKGEKAHRKEDKPKHLKEDVLAQLRKVASDAGHRNAEKAKKLLEAMKAKKAEKKAEKKAPVKKQYKMPSGYLIEDMLKQIIVRDTDFSEADLDENFPEAIEELGGGYGVYDEVVEEIVEKLRKKGFSVKGIARAFADIDEGYAPIFEDYAREHK
jgi:hypothetical protein